MKFSITLGIALLLIAHSIKSYADENNTQPTEHKNVHSDIVNTSSPVSQLLLTQDLTIAPLDSYQDLQFTPQIKGEFSTQRLSIEAGMLQSKQESNWSKYYFQGSVTLHQHNEFNVSLMANIEQLNSFNYHNEKTSILDNTLVINETEINYSYGIITSYSVSPAWQFSGGIIHAQPLNESAQNSWYGDANMALIGTTYSF